MGCRQRGRSIALLATAIGVSVFVLAVWLFRAQIFVWCSFTPLGLNQQGRSEYLHRATGIVFVSVPGGSFWMGAQKEDGKGQNYDPAAEPDEAPVHEVTLSAFFISKYEVTQAQWRAVMGQEAAHFRGDHRPVEQVSWLDCQEFCNRTGLALPTEAQWEYACRAGTPGAFAGPGAPDDVTWYQGNALTEGTHEVGEKLPNAFGLHDMHGNVWEWCEDVYNRDFYEISKDSGIDPHCEGSSGVRFRVTRGGGAYYPAELCRSAVRSQFRENHRHYLMGFRVVWPRR